MDGRAQRRALTAAERAIAYLGGAEPDKARRAAALAADLDQIGLYAGLPEAVDRAAADLEAAGSVSAGARQALIDLLAPGPLTQAVESQLPG